MKEEASELITYINSIKPSTELIRKREGFKPYLLISKKIFINDPAIDNHYKRTKKLRLKLALRGKGFLGNWHGFELYTPISQ